MDHFLLNYFLKENKCYDKFYFELKRQGKEKNIEVKPSIIGAFTWSGSDQGHEFWYELSEKWNKFKKNPSILKVKFKII